MDCVTGHTSIKSLEIGVEPIIHIRACTITGHIIDPVGELFRFAAVE
jgi:hypothetical protein